MFGRNELLPGADVAVSVMLPMPTEWWLRPVSSACAGRRAQRGGVEPVVPQPARGQPLRRGRAARAAERARRAEAHVVEQDDQHVRRARRAAAAARSAGYAVSGSFASYVVSPGAGRSGIGSIVRAWRSAVMASFHRARPVRRSSEPYAAAAVSSLPRHG